MTPVLTAMLWVSTGAPGVPPVPVGSSAHDADLDDAAPKPAASATEPVMAVAVATSAAVTVMGVLAVALPLLLVGGTAVAVGLAPLLFGLPLGPLTTGTGAVLASMALVLALASTPAALVGLALDVSKATTSRDLDASKASMGAPLPVGPWENALSVRPQERGQAGPRVRAGFLSALTAGAGAALILVYSMFTLDVLLCITVMLAVVAVLVVAGLVATLMGGASLLGGLGACNPGSCGNCGNCGNCGPCPDTGCASCVGPSTVGVVGVLMPSLLLPWMVGARLMVSGLGGATDALRPAPK